MSDDTKEWYGPNSAQVHRLVNRLRRATPEELARIGNWWTWYTEAGETRLIYSRAWNALDALQEAHEGDNRRCNGAVAALLAARGWENAYQSPREVRTPSMLAVRALVLRGLVDEEYVELLLTPIWTALGHEWETDEEDA